MKRTAHIEAIAALALMALAVSACAPAPDTAAIERVPSKRVAIARTSVRHEGHASVVAGVLRGRRGAAFPARGHVDATVVAPDGGTLGTARSADVYVPRRRGSGWTSGRPFAVRLPAALPEGGTVRLAFHSGAHGDE